MGSDPLLIGSELVRDFKRPPNLAPDQRYVAGLTELKAQLGERDKRWIICIEGPGGVGKSSLAFQIARWAAAGSHNRGLVGFPILPVLLESLGKTGDKIKNLDDAVAERLRFIMDTPKISGPLLQAFLRSKRVLAVVDGVSEMPREVTDQSIRPETGAVNTRAMVLTSRWSASLPDSLVIRPQGLTLAFLDRVLDELTAAVEKENEGNEENIRDEQRELLDSDQREEFRTHIKAIMQNAREGAQKAGLPIIFLKLMLDRAYKLLQEHKSFDDLPTTLSELVTSYTARLLHAERDLPLTMQQARKAAQVCMGKDRRPIPRSEEKYKEKELTRDVLSKFVDAGLMVRSGDDDDPFYKFALGPVAEELDVGRLAKALRDGKADQVELDELLARWGELPEDFTRALRRAAAEFRQDIEVTYTAVAARLWPEKVDSGTAVKTDAVRR